MNVTDYTYLMNKPDVITEKQADALSSVLNEFPYFQSARALRLKGLYNQNSFKYNYALKVTAAHTADRSVLFDFITSETFTSIQNDFFEQKLRDLLEIKVFDSEIISPEQIQKAIAVKVDPIEQSILNSIKEAEAKTVAEPIKTEQPKVPETTTIIIEEPAKEEPVITPVVNESSNAVEEITAASFEEPTKTEEPKNHLNIDPSIFLAIKEAQSVTYEKVVKKEEPKELPAIDESIFATLKDAHSVTYEKPNAEPESTTNTKEAVAEEEAKADPIERSILNSIKAAENVDVEEKTEEPKIDTAIEQSIINSIKEAESVDTEIENSKTDSFAEETVSNTIEEEEDSVIEEMIIPEFKINPIERSILSSIKEAETVRETETPITAETKQEIETEVEEETVNEIEEQTEEVIEQENEEIEESIESLNIAEEHLEIEKPLDFSFNEKHSFQEWLQLSRTEPIDRSKDASEDSESDDAVAETKNKEQPVVDVRQKKAEIIDKFIENNPKISPIKSGNISPIIQFESNDEDNSYIMTETLARVYLEQKKYTKAIQAYEILILKYPEKITFFADRISDIKILQQNNNNNN
ncbi:hypothetical protein ACFSJW_08865 [Flavobacterium artemisiae]|uniref:Tetratricopeptide repeat protein n=1 Tax=Flavobacterium artemisiae TaxID=2126556 RepID=A0ABW4HFB4_9FLAO